MRFFTCHFEVIEGLASTVTCLKVLTHTKQIAPFFSLIAGLFLKQGRWSNFHSLLMEHQSIPFQGQATRQVNKLKQAHICYPKIKQSR